MSDTRPERRTAQKDAVRQALDDAGGFITAGELHARLNREGHPIGLATVYRHLKGFVEADRADTITDLRGQLFRACEPGDHHHHLVCEDCGAAVELDTPDEEWIRVTATRNDFTVTRHIVEVFGLCADCREAA